MDNYNHQNLFPANTVMNATVNSTAAQIYKCITFSIQVVFTGTPSGSFKLQASDDKAYGGTAQFGNQGQGVPTNWTDIAGSTFTVAAAGNVAWDYSWPGFTFVRIVYTDSSGGTSTAVITSSTFNGKG